MNDVLTNISGAGLYSESDDVSGRVPGMGCVGAQTCTYPGRSPFLPPSHENNSDIFKHPTHYFKINSNKS